MESLNLELEEFTQKREINKVIEKIAIIKVATSKIAFLREHFGKDLGHTHPFTLLLALKNGIKLKDGTRIFWELR